MVGRQYCECCERSDLHDTWMARCVGINYSISVVVPNHLIRQWHEEIEKCIGSNMNVVVMKSMLDMNCTVYGDIINAGILSYISFSFRFPFPFLLFAVSLFQFF